MKHYTLRQIKESYNPAADSTSWISRRILRPISFYLTFLMLKCKITANQATVLGFIFGAISLVFFMTGRKNFFDSGVFFYLLFFVCDFADGNIARVTDSASYYGKFLDGAVDTIVETLLPLSLAIGFFVSDNRLVFLFIGIATAVLLMFSSYIINRASFFYRWLSTEENDKKIVLNPMNTNKLPIKRIYIFMADFKFILLFIALFTGLTTYLLLTLLAILIVWSSLLIFLTMIDANLKLNVHRVSKMDVRLKDNN